MNAEHDPVLPLLTPAQASEQLNKSGEWLRKLANRGAVPHHKLGGSTRFCTTCLTEIVSLTYRPTEKPTKPSDGASTSTTKTPPRAAARRYTRQRYPRAAS